MDDETLFLKALRDNPHDGNLRQVYADWLEERGDPRGELLRIESKLAGLPPKGVPARQLRRRLQELRAAVDPAWLARIDNTAIEGCVRFDFECPKRWEQLRRTGDPFTRFCPVCEKKVHYCTSVEEAQRHASRRECVALDSQLLRTPGDSRVRPLRLPGRTVRMGRIRIPRPSPQPVSPEPLPEPQPPAPPPRFRRGQRVIIQDGILTGASGEIKSVDLERQSATVSVKRDGRRTTIELDFDALEPDGARD
jgi:uncharacterized protein (TIGR02996 family)